MKHKVIISAIFAAIVLMIVTGVVWLRANDAPTPQVISGRITGISNGCHVDGVCSVTLDGSKSIVTGCGLMANDKTCESYDQSKLQTGQQVEATVMKAEAGRYNLECDSCTIRVTDN